MLSLSFILLIVVGIILARLLMPSDFGIIGMAGIVTGLAGVFQDLGFGQALVQRAELRPEHSRSAFWMTLIMGTVLYTALYFGAPWAGEYFHDERMVPVLRLMAELTALEGERCHIYCEINPATMM